MLALAGVTLNVQDTPAWMTEKLWAPTLMAPLRLCPVEFASTE
jgi:hypothetical protein